MTGVLAVSIGNATRILADIGCRHIVDGQPQQTIRFDIDLCAIIGMDSLAVQEPFSVWFWPTGGAGRESGLHSFVDFRVTDLLQERWRLSLWTSVTVRK